MGKLLVLLRYVFFVFSADIKERRRHVHVRDSKRGLTNLCKFWLEPKIELEYNYGFSKKQLNEIERLVIQHKRILNNQLEQFYQEKPVKAIKKQQ